MVHWSRASQQLCGRWVGLSFCSVLSWSSNWHQDSLGFRIPHCVFWKWRNEFKEGTELSSCFFTAKLCIRLVMILCVWSIIFTSIYHQGFAKDEDHVGFLLARNFVPWVFGLTFDHLRSNSENIAVFAYCFVLTTAACCHLCCKTIAEKLVRIHSRTLLKEFATEGC